MPDSVTTKCLHPQDCDYPDCGTRSFPELKKCKSQMTLERVEFRTEIIDRIIRMAELAIQGKDVAGLSDEMVMGIKMIQHPPMIARNDD